VHSFFGLELHHRLEILPRILGSLQAWRARDADGRPITAVCSRPDIITHHLAGSSYCSNIPRFERDLRDIAARPAGPHELRLRELRYVESGRIPIGIFEPCRAWPLWDLTGFVRCDASIGATIVLEIFRSYTTDDAATAVTPAGELIRLTLPHFAQVWRSETPSFTGAEPELCIRSRIAEGRRLLEAMSGARTEGPDDETPEAAAAFVAQLTALADRASAGPALARLLHEAYTLPIPDA